MRCILFVHIFSHASELKKNWIFKNLSMSCDPKIKGLILVDFKRCF